MPDQDSFNLPQNAERFRAIAESSVNWEIWINPDGRLLWTNPSCRRVSGYSEDELLVMPLIFEHLAHPADQPRLQGLAEQPSGSDVEFRLLCKDGQVRWVTISWQPLTLAPPQAENCGVRASLHDITPRKQAEEELVRYRERLEELVSERTAELRQRNLELEAEIHERIQAENAEHDQRTLAEALADSAAAIAGTLDLEEVLDRILANVGRVVPHDAGDIRLVDEEQRGARLARHSYPERYRKQVEAVSYLPFSDTYYLPRMFTTAHSVIVLDILKDPDWKHRDGFEWVRSYLAAPLVYHSQVMGFITLLSAQVNFFTPEQASRLEMFANQAAIALRNARLYEHARELATWEERQRLAREMHDAVSQTLFSAAVIAESLPLVWKRSPQKLDSNLDELQRLTRGALAEMRTLLVELRPASLVTTDLGDLLRQLVDAVRGRNSLEIRLEIEGSGTLPPAQQTVFFRTAQEALNNTIKHAAARCVKVSLRYNSSQASLHVTDDGCGFDPAQIPAGRMGFSIMRERAEQIGAHLELHSTRGQGMRLALDWQEQPIETLGA